MARSRKPEETPEESAPGGDLDHLKDELDSLLGEHDDPLDSLPDDPLDSLPDEAGDDLLGSPGDAAPVAGDASGAFEEAPAEPPVEGLFDTTSPEAPGGEGVPGAPQFAAFKSTGPTFGEKLKARFGAMVQYVKNISGWGWTAILTVLILCAGFILGMYSLSQARTDYDAYKSWLYGAGLLMLVGIFMATWLSLGEIYHEMVGRVLPFLGPNREGEGFEEGAEELPVE